MFLKLYYWIGKKVRDQRDWNWMKSEDIGMGHSAGFCSRVLRLPVDAEWGMGEYR